jgi:hypothetical protein
MEAAGSSETLTPTYQSAKHYNPKDSNLQVREDAAFT